MTCPGCNRETNTRAVWFLFPFWYCQWCGGSFGPWAWAMSWILPQRKTVKMVSYAKGGIERYFVAVWYWFTQGPDREDT